MNGNGNEPGGPPWAVAHGRRIIVTGAGGFIGNRLVKALSAVGYPCTAVTREVNGRRWPEGTAVVRHPGFGAVTGWAPILDGAHAVVHAAGMAHLPVASRGVRRELRTVNVLGTEQVVRAATVAGVRDFILLSSIKAVAERSGGEPIDERAPPRPEDCYGYAKLAAERRVARIAARHPELRIICLRPPLVYGAEVGANFAALARLVARGLPLPFASIDNRRSLIYVGNLVNAILRCIARTDVAGGVYHLSDGAPVSTPTLVRAIAAAQGRPIRLFPVPGGLVRVAARVLGRGSQWARLSDSLAVADDSFREDFDWSPPFSLQQGLADMMRGPTDRA